MINYYTIKITGKSRKNLLNKIFKNNINVFDIKILEKEIILKCSYEDYKKIKKINYINEITIININGTKKVKRQIKSYSVFIITFICFSFLLLFISNHIYFIKINTEKKELYALINNTLKENNIKLYMKKQSNKKLNTIEDKIKNKLKDNVEWIEIKQKGITMEVDLVERIKDKEETDETTPKNIVARKNGYIVDIYGEKGEIVKFKGDYVKKGDIIISGDIHRNDNIVNKVKAKGKVYAKTWYKVISSSPLYYKNKTIKNSNNKISLNILGKEINIIKYKTKPKKEKQINLNLSNMKITFKTENIYEYNKQKYNLKELKELLNKRSIQKMKSSLNSDEYIIKQKTLKNYYKDDKMYIETFFEIYEEISQEEDIKEILIEEDDN